MSPPTLIAQRSGILSVSDPTLIAQRKDKLSEPTTVVQRRHKYASADIYSKTGEKSLDEILLQPYKHIAEHVERGKCQLLTSAYNYWFKISAEKVGKLEDIIRIMYNGTFLLDDIEDKSTLRRGAPVAHSIYGAPSTIAASNYSMIIALEKILDFIEAEIVPEDRDETTAMAIDVIVEFFRGQGLEIYWREKLICPTEEEYCSMVRMKSSGLFKMLSMLMSGCSTRKENLERFGEMLAVAFQIQNDYDNLASEKVHERKTYCEDITEGKCSHPILHAINSRPGDNRIMEILSLATTDYKLKKHCLSLIEQCGSLEYTRNKIVELRQELRQESKKYGENPNMDIFITFVLGKD